MSIIIIESIDWNILIILIRANNTLYLSNGAKVRRRSKTSALSVSHSHTRKVRSLVQSLFARLLAHICKHTQTAAKANARATATNEHSR